MTTVDCLVLSGGGAKGAYGAGVAKAIAVYRDFKRVQSSVCYIGTSAGALNAAVLAAADADALIGFWTSVTSRAILGVRIRSPRFQSALHFLTRRRFFSKDREDSLPVTDVLKRTLEIYHHIHTEPIVRAWSRINDEVRDHAQRLAEFLRWLSAQAIPPVLQTSIAQQVRQHLGTLGGATARQDLGELIEVEPSMPLGDTLDFDPVRIKETIKCGFLDMLDVFRNMRRLNPAEYRILVDVQLFGP